MRLLLLFAAMTGCAEQSLDDQIEDADAKANVEVACRYDWPEFVDEPRWQACATVCADAVPAASDQGTCDSPFIVEVDGVRGACVGLQDQVNGQLADYVRWVPCPT